MTHLRVVRHPRLRCTLVWLLVALTCAGAVTTLGPLALRTARDAMHAGPSATFEQLLVAVCAGAVSLCASWAGLVTTLVVAEAWPGDAPSSSGRNGGRASGVVPGLARRLVLGACGVAMVGGLSGGLLPGAAHADPGVIHVDRRDVHSSPAALAGLPAPDRAMGSADVRELEEELDRLDDDLSLDHRESHATPPDHPRGNQDTTQSPRQTTEVVVRPGDSLWTIAADSLQQAHLPAEEHDVALEWRRIYAANRAVLGDDPDLIIAATRLSIPSENDHRP